MNTQSYALPRQSKAWKNALDAVKHLLPTDINASHAFDDLVRLPIFAVVVVLKNNTKERASDIIKSALASWADNNPKWQIQDVNDDTDAKAHAHKIVAATTLADVAVYRSLLIPTDPAIMTPEKKDAAAHIIDEQLTGHLTKSLAADDPTSDNLTSAIRLDECLDVHILSIAQVLSPHRLICFDMDSTLIEQEVIVELAKKAGVTDKVADITERAMRGEIDFSQSFAERVSLLEGLPMSVVDDIIKQHITFSSGAHALMRALKAMGCHTALVSGGFEPFARHVAQSLGMDEYHANPLLNEDGTVTGYIDPTIIDGKQKAHIVQNIAKRLGLPLSDVVCVGDGANDLPMMEQSGIGIAYHAKPIVKARADASINITGLEGVLYVLGHRFDKVT